VRAVGCLCLPSYSGQACEASDSTLSIVKSIQSGSTDPSVLERGVLCNVGTVAAELGSAEVLGAAMRGGLNGDCMSEYELTPLHAAASGGQVGVLADLLRKGVRVDVLSSESRPRTPIMVAAPLQRLEVVDELVVKDPDPCRMVAGFSLLASAAMSGSPAILSRVLPICTTHKDWKGRGYDDMIQTLIDAVPRGTDLSELSAGALFVAAIKNRIRVVETLIAHGGSLKVRDRDGKTLLMGAAAADQEEMIGTLLRHGVSADTFDNSGMSALSWGASVGAVHALSRLLSAGVNVDMRKEPCGNTALPFAVSLRRVAAVRELVARGASPQLVNCDG